MGLESQGRSFHDRFLIADVRIAGVDFPCERRFWFDPPFHPGQSVLLHKQADGVWRIDFQLGWQADSDEERRPEKIMPRVRAVLDSIGAAGCEVEIVWASVYTFSCLRMAHFRRGRVLFAGDAAHGVSPFGARGANSGVQDADNLAWKLAMVTRGEAPDALLDSYAGEREFAADENILHSTRATDFITPKSEVSRLFRDAVLDLSRDHAFARRLVNSGRLSVATTLRESALSTPDIDAFDGAMVPGAAAADAPLMRDGRATWLLRELGPGFTLLFFGTEADARGVRVGCASAHQPASGGTRRCAEAHPTGQCTVLCIDEHALVDSEGLLAKRYDARPGTAYLLRPDRHVAARWRMPTEAAVRAALARACGRTAENAR